MKKKYYQLDKPIEELIGFAKKDFKIKFESVRAGDSTLEVMQIADMQAYIDKLVAKSGNKNIDLPLWSKIWPSCVFLGVILPSMIQKGAKVLEIGSGVGVTGLIVANQGYEITMTDYDPNALLFCQINTLKNGLEDLITVKKADFTKSDLEGTFDFIVGCEVLANPHVHEPLLGFLDRYLSQDPKAQVILAMDASRTTGRNFFTLASEKFDIAMKRFEFSEDGETRTTAVFRLRRKQA